MKSKLEKYFPASKNNKIRHYALGGGSICPITARQYGEVVLPDAASDHDPDTRQLAGQKAVTVQGGYGALFVVQVQSWLSITRVAVQV